MQRNAAIPDCRLTRHHGQRHDRSRRKRHSAGRGIPGANHTGKVIECADVDQRLLRQPHRFRSLRRQRPRDATWLR